MCGSGTAGNGWIHFDRTEGESGPVQLTVVVDESQGYDRKGSVVFVLEENLYHTVPISQHGKLNREMSDLFSPAFWEFIMSRHLVHQALDRDVGKVYYSDVLNIKKLDLSGQTFDFMADLAFFERLEELNCSNCDLSVFTTPMPSLQVLICNTNQLKELDPALARAVIEQETGKKIEEIYKEFRDKPLGSASIGQAHYAVLLDGTPVVTKVQRPLIADMMRQDFILLKKIASIFNVVMEGADNAEDQLDLLSVIEEFEKVTEEELDCRVEAANTKFFMENCIEDETKVTCPTVYDDLTTERIFTMSFVDGYSISKKDRVIEDGYSVEEIGTNIINNYVHQILDVGVFHADPHQGNIMITHGIPCWIDFGMLGRITEGDINIIQSIVLALLEGDVETIANAIMSMGAASPKTNRDRLIEDIDVFLDRYMTVTSISDLDVSVLFEEICALAEKHHITMPGKFTMLVRSLTTIEGVIEQFCPELNLFELLSNKMMERAKKSFDLEQEIINTGKEMLEIGKKTAKIPVLASDLLKSAARGRMKMNMELTGYEELLVKGADMVRNIVLAFFACVLFIGSCFLCSADLTPKAPGGVPVLAAIGLVFSVSLAIFAVKNISQGK